MAENEEGVETYAEARPLQFFRSIKDKLSLAELKRLCNKAVPVIRHRYGEKIDCDTFYLEDLLLELH